MANSMLDTVEHLVDQLTPLEQVRMLGYLTHRIGQVVASMHPPESVSPPDTGDLWETFIRIGERLSASDRLESDTLTAAVLAMRR